MTACLLRGRSGSQLDRYLVSFTKCSPDKGASHWPRADLGEIPDVVNRGSVVPSDIFQRFRGLNGDTRYLYGIHITGASLRSHVFS